MLGWLRPAALLASRRKRSTNSVVVREARVQDLQSDLPAQVTVISKIDVGHAAAAKLADDLVAIVEYSSYHYLLVPCPSLVPTIKFTLGRHGASQEEVKAREPPQ